ncbi:potassium-transporting ATPase subunit KdpC [Blastococcus sp. TF02A-26]|uniref:potassium-transporting ATPase subunit KdpC n=1 Tax=Blastococcus sp. TF02A-26 TaxID=2250577 RepID=UPI000DEB87EC|nr:potassium-transporting ATPase subunit KdpC [Blastococcus sp. TF02A-26]RBY90666.1 potassium-transporting ATPase subunit C [Blastococcus sp. TF02A-26]
MPALRWGRQLVAAVRLLLVATVVLGLGYPLAVTGIAQFVAPGRADGSLVEVDGEVVGSSLIGQAFTDADGAPLPQYFQTRPSASGYDGAASGGSNLGPNSAELADLVQQRRAAVAAFNGVDPADVPPDAVTASASGLDPDISPAYAAIQVDRVAQARGLDAGTVRRLVADATAGRDLGFVGAPHVRVLELNLALDRATGR